MNNPNEFTLIQAALLSFAPMFVSACLLRTNGPLGILALIGVVASAALVVMKLEGFQLDMGAVLALVALIVGGKWSDRREQQRLVRIQDAERHQRDAKRGSY